MPVILYHCCQLMASKEKEQQHKTMVSLKATCTRMRSSQVNARLSDPFSPTQTVLSEMNAFTTSKREVTAIKPNNSDGLLTLIDCEKTHWH